MTSYKLTMFTGNDLDQRYVVKRNAVVVDITTAELVFSVKSDRNDDAYIFQRKNAAAGGGADQISMTDAINGEFIVLIAEALTNDVAEGGYVYDIEMVLDGKKKTIVSDKFILTTAITSD